MSPSNHGFGGAIYWDGQNGSIYDSIFLENSAPYDGSAIKWEGGDNGKIIDCTFDKNHATVSGGAIYWSLADYGLTSNCTFNNNYQDGDSLAGGVSWIDSDYCIISHCNFSNNDPFAICFYDNCNNYSVDNNYVIPDENNIFAISEYVHKRNSNLKLNFSSFTYHDVQNFTIELKDEYGGISNKTILVTFIQNNINKTYNLVTNKEGIAILSNELNELDVGNWDVTVFFKGNDNYYAINTTVNIYVSPLTSSLIISDVNTTWNQNTSFFAYVTNDNHIINEGFVSFYIGDEFIGNAPVFGGIATLDYIPTKEGNFSVSAIFSNAKNYLDSNSSSNLFVNAILLHLAIDNSTVGVSSSFAVGIKDLLNNPINDGVIGFYIDDELVGTVSVVGGFVSLDYVPLVAGDHIVKVILTGCDGFVDYNLSSDWFVNPDRTVLRLNNFTTNVCNDVFLSALVNSLNGVTINEGNVDFYVDGVFIGSSSVVDGIATLEYTPSVVGVKELSAIFNSSNFVDSDNRSNLYVNKVKTKLTGSSVTTVYQVGKKLVAILKDYKGSVLANKKVIIKVGNISKTLTTNARGQVSVDISSLIPKTYTASISFAGDSYFNKSSIIVKVVVKKANPKCIALAKTFRVKVKTKKYSITLKNNLGKVMKNTKVTLRVSGKTFYAKTNYKGIAIFKITNLKKKGRFTAVITYAGSKYYNKLTKKPIITIKA